MVTAVYLLVSGTMLACAILLLRGYARARMRLLLWSGVCFLALSLSNALVFVDLVLIPDRDLYSLRLFSATAGMSFLMYGLIWESK